MDVTEGTEASAAPTRETAEPPARQERIHGLDALRAVLMTLGVVLHTLLAYLPPSPVGGVHFKDPWAQAKWLGIILDAIHVFRMPAFFVLAGYFGALLWRRRGRRVMLQNRFERVALPLVVFLLLLWPLLVLCVGYGFGLVDGVQDPLPFTLGMMREDFSYPRDLFHLWFLYHLVFITAFVAGAAALMERYGLAWPGLVSRLRRSAESPLRSVLVFGLINLLWCVPMGWQTVGVSAAWLPSPATLVYYLGCYSLGWLFFVAELELSTLQRRAWTLLGVGLACVALRAALALGADHLPAVAREGGFETLTRYAKMLTFSVALVAFTRGVSGLFLRYCGSASPRWRYFSDSSYWVYLLHLPLAFLLPALMVGWRAPAPLKALVATALVAGVCLVSYDSLVRATFVGRFLNGRRYPRARPLASAVATVLAFSFITTALIQPVDPANQPSLWAEQKQPAELVPEEKPSLLFDGKAAQLPHQFLRGCVKVRSYAVCPGRSMFKHAVAACELLDATLVVIDDEAEDRLVSKLVKRLLDRPYWLAMSDQEEEGRWRWLNGAAANFEGWIPGEPNDHHGVEDCGAGNWPRKANELGWNDLPCRRPLSFVCEGL